MLFIRQYAVTLVAFLTLDALWLGVIAKSFYRSQIGTLLAAKPNWLAAGAFYLLFIVGQVVFVVGPASRTGSLPRAALLGALFGLVTYAAYDLTNMATLDRWPWCLTLVDMAWGAVLCAITTTVAVVIAGRAGA